MNVGLADRAKPVAKSDNGSKRMSGGRSGRRRRSLLIRPLRSICAAKLSPFADARRFGSDDARHGRYPAFTRPEADGHLDILVEFTENGDHPVQRETTELGIANTGKFRIGNAGQLFRIARRKLAFVDDADDFCRRQRARLLQIGVGPSKIAKYVAAARTSSISSFFISRFRLSLPMDALLAIWLRMHGSPRRSAPIYRVGPKRQDIRIVVRRRAVDGLPSHPVGCRAAVVATA